MFPILHIHIIQKLRYLSLFLFFFFVNLFGEEQIIVYTNFLLNLYCEELFFIIYIVILALNSVS